MAKKKKWMQKAFGKHPGALHRMLGVPLGKPIPPKMLAAAAQKGGLLGKRARPVMIAKRINLARGKRRVPAYKGK